MPAQCCHSFYVVLDRTGLRASTENVAYAVGLGAACEIAKESLERVGVDIEIITPNEDGCAGKHVSKNIITVDGRLLGLRDLFERLVIKGSDDEGNAEVPEAMHGSSDSVRVNGPGLRRLPNTASLSFKNVSANRILDEVADDIAASAGAACHAGCVKISHVLDAMGACEEFAQGTVRFSLGKTTTETEVRHAAACVRAAVARLRTE